MKNDYMSIFNELFYDVSKDNEANMLMSEICDLLASIIIKYGELVNEFSFAEKREDDFVDTVIMLFLRKIMEHLDAIIILAEKCCLSQAQIILRTLFETTVSFKFILKEDTRKRAAAYYLYHHYEEIEKMKYFDDKTDMGKMMKNNIGEKEFAQIVIRCRDKRDALARLIKNNAVFSDIDELRKRKISQKQKKYRKKKVYVSWYETCSNIENLYTLMKDMGGEKYYDSLYGGLSMEVHGYNAGTGMIPDEEGLCLKALRDPVDGFNVIELAASFCMSTLNDVYKYLQDSEEERRDFREYFCQYRYQRDELEKRYKKLFCRE